MPQLYALLVGINEYHPKSIVSNLRGCVNDVQAMRAFLLEQYAHLISKPEQIMTLLNQQATRAQVIQSFQSHLCQQAKPGDFVLFYYSGHGSREKTSAEFLRYESKGQNETLVCHDSRLPDGQDLADKELAVLLSRVTDKAFKVVILDSCHSGSATRQVADIALGATYRFEMPRFGDVADNGRALRDYLLPGDNFYTAQPKDKVMPPSSPHVLLSACDRDQVAMETADQRGLFTKTLIQVLTDAQGRISYNDLQQRVRAAIIAGGGKQTPKVEPFEGFAGNFGFLMSKPIDTHRHLVTFNQTTQQWQVAYGAAQGMPVDPTDLQKVRLRLFRENPNKTISRAAPISAQVGSVQLNASTLMFSSTTVRRLNRSATYQAEFTALPRSYVLPVWLNGQPALKTQFEKWYKDFPNGAIMWVNRPEEARYELRLTGKTIEVWNLRNHTLIQGFEAMTAEAAETMTSVLGNIEKAERTRRLNKRATQLNESDFEVVFSRIDQRLNVLETFKRTDPGKTFEIQFDYRQENGVWQPIFYKVEVQNNSRQDVYVTLLFLSRMFDVQAYYPSQLLKAGHQLTELKRGGLIIKDDKLNSVTNQFKVIFSTSELDISAMTQTELELGLMRTPSRTAVSKGDAIDFEFAALIDDWFVQNIEVTLNRCITQVSAQQRATISQAGITIAPHPQFRGNISVASTATATRAIDADFRQLAAAYGGELVQLSPDTRSADPQAPTVITISDIQNAESLKTQPLEIDFQHRLADGQNLLAVAIDAESGLLLPVGTSKRRSDTLTTISISNIPVQETASRSIGRALRFALMKFRGKQPDSIFLLRRVIYNATDIEQTVEGVAEAVRKSNKVLLVIHGIIGNTSEQAAAMRFAVEHKDYDLVLSFDYENLNTRIEDIAVQLNSRLSAVGFNMHDNKELHIVAHSMGGLVCRYAIENLQAHTYVDRLIMVGTPNGGSNFGKLPGAIQTLHWLLGLGLNFAPKAVTDIIGMLQVASSKVLVTLGQMDPNSPFIKQLAANRRPPGTKYITLAGNIKDYRGGDAPLFMRLFEKIELAVGKLAYWNQPNDIAVSVAAIGQIPPAIGDMSQQLPCHHLNYFSNGDSISTLKQLI